MTRWVDSLPNRRSLLLGCALFVLSILCAEISALIDGLNSRDSFDIRNWFWEVLINSGVFAGPLLLLIILRRFPLITIPLAAMAGILLAGEFIGLLAVIGGLGGRVNGAMFMLSLIWMWLGILSLGIVGLWALDWLIAVSVDAVKCWYRARGSLK